MVHILTITRKGQITLSQKLLQELEIKKGDKITVTVKDKQAILTGMGRGLLDIAGIGGKLTLPKGKTIDDLIHESHEEGVGHDLR